MTDDQADSLPEPWMRGPLADVAPHVMPVFFSFTQVREDLAKHTAGLDREVWRQVGSLPALGFHLRHMAGSVDRLSTYLTDGQLKVAQLAFLRSEAEPGATLSALLLALDASLRIAEQRLATLDAGALYEPRYVGRKRLPSTVLGLLVHLAEHTQRHLGQAITTSKLLRDTAALAD